MVLAIAPGLNELGSIVSLEHSHSVHTEALSEAGTGLSNTPEL